MARAILLHKVYFIQQKKETLVYLNPFFTTMQLSVNNHIVK